MNIYKKKTMKSNSKETNRIKEPSKFAIKFANTVFVSGILYLVLVTMYAVYKIYNHHETQSTTFYYSSILFAVLTATLLELGLKKLSDNLRVNLSVLFFTIVITVYGFETYLQLMMPSYDKRTKAEVIEDLIDSGRVAYRDIYPSLFRVFYHL